ncbi:NSP-interacting kinase 1-like protein [Tanacetum coccineum]
MMNMSQSRVRFLLWIHFLLLTRLTTLFNKLRSKNGGRKEIKGNRIDAKRFCIGCNQEGHTVDQSFEIIGYPDWSKGKKAKKQGRIAAHVNSGFDEYFSGESPFDMGNKNEVANNQNGGYYQKLVAAVCQEVMKMFRGKGLASEGNAGTSHASIWSCCTASFPLFCHPNMNIRIDSVTDRGASDHMTPNFSLFIIVTYLKNTILVHLPNGTSKTVTIVSQPKIVRSDNGTKIVNATCASFFQSKGVLHQMSMAYIPQQNGRVERKHRNLLDIARAIRSHANLPIRFWGDCILAATCLINKMPVKILDWKTPFERLVVRGFNQKEGLDYKHTFSLVAKLATIRVIVALATAKEWPLHQLDVNNAFLHGYTDEEIYMLPPEGYHKALPGQVCNSNSEILSLKASLDHKFTIKDLGLAKYFLGIEIYRTQHGTHLNQRKYILNLLSDAGLTGEKPATFPFPTQLKLSLDKGTPLSDESSYKRLVGRLLYLTMTRPDISYAAQHLSQFVSAPKDMLNDKKIIAGYCIFLGHSLVSWKTKKQPTVSRSSTEAEYTSMAATTCELLWLSFLLKDLHIKVKLPITLFCDNKYAQQLAANPYFHDRTKHLAIDCHFTRNKVQDGFLQTAFIPTHLQLAYIMTKALGQEQHSFLADKLGLLEAPT